MTEIASSIVTCDKPTCGKTFDADNHWMHCPHDDFAAYNLELERVVNLVPDPPMIYAPAAIIKVAADPDYTRRH